MKLLDICQALKSWNEEAVGEIKDVYDWAEKVGYGLYESEDCKYWEAVSKAVKEAQERYIADLEGQVSHTESQLAYARERVNILQSLICLAPSPLITDNTLPQDVLNFSKSYWHWVSVGLCVLKK